MSGLSSAAGMSGGFGVGSVSDGFLSDAGIASSSAGSATGVPFAGVLQEHDSADECSGPESVEGGHRIAEWIGRGDSRGDDRHAESRYGV